MPAKCAEASTGDVISMEPLLENLNIILIQLMLLPVSMCLTAWFVST